MARIKASTLKTLCGMPLLVAAGLAPAISCSSQPAEEPTGEKFQKVVYAVRQHTLVNGNDVSINVAGGMGQVIDYLRYVPGGRLEVKDLASGTVQNILADARYSRADVSSLDVSFDAKKITFSMKLNGDDKFHIYTADLEQADSGWDIQQLTFGPHDDIHPIFVPGGRIAFVTNQAYTSMGTRADEYNHARRVTQIATISSDGGDADRKLCSQNLSNTVNLFLLKSGRIGFSRWEHLENVNDVKLFAMNPDCTQMVAIAGQHGKPANSIVQVAETNDANVFIAVATSRESTIQSGALVQVDARSEANPAVFDEGKADISVITASVPRDMEPSPVGRYRTPSILPDNRILTSWAKGTVSELEELSLTPPDFGVYVYDPETRSNQLIVNYEDSWELYAKAVAERTEPPILSSIQNTPDATVPVLLGSVDVKQTSLHSVHGNTVTGAQFDGTPMDEALSQTVKVRIIEGFSSEAAPGATMFGLTMAEGAAILGEAEVRSDGSWLAEIPPYVPVHLQAVDEFDLSIRNQTTWIQGMPGEDRVCGGCHERRTESFVAGGQQLTEAAAIGAESFVAPVADRTEYPWAYANDSANVNEVQKLLTAKCSSCHNESTNGNGPQEFYTLVQTDPLSGETTSYEIPRLDLSDRPITVTYDNNTEAWPASYVSLFYPSAMMMEMDDSEVMGNVPPLWAIPSDARNSALIEKLNIVSSRDSGRTAWALGEAFSDPNIAGGTRTMHPGDQGDEYALTREERAILIRAIDMGGQYYSRQNTDFQPYGNDPVAGTSY